MWNASTPGEKGASESDEVLNGITRLLDSVKGDEILDTEQ
jgi:hypothetical protein